jgi:hypothetical protein
MRAENFSWKRSIYLQAGGIELDIHNNYDFRRIVYDIAERILLLEWHRGDGEWVSKALPSNIRLQMNGIYDLRISPCAPEMPFTEDDCLNSFGYDCDEEWADGQFWVDGAPEPSWRWSFLFQSGMEIQVGGESASTSVTP